MGGFSKDLETLISPKFDEKVLIDILQKIYKIRNCVLNCVTFNNDCVKGDSYLSTVTRFIVHSAGSDESGEVKSFTFHAIAKSLPTNIGRRETFRSLDFFNNEVIFYNTVWKAMDDFQKSKVPGGVFNAIPLCISALADGRNDYIVLEDLGFKNYVGIDRSKGLDYTHAQLIMRLFAQFHAISLAFKNQQPTEFEAAASSLEETYFAEKYRSWYIEFQTKGLYKVIRDAVEKQLPSKYLAKLNELLETDLFGTLIHHSKSTGSLSVITHGDAWVPNFLVNYDSSGNPLRGVMIDFQLARYASLANDVTFFLYSCTEQSLRVKYWDKLIDDYHKMFLQTLVALGCSQNLLALDALKAEIKTNAVFGIGMSMEAIVMSLLEEDEIADLDLIQGDQGVALESVWVIHPFKQEEKRQRLADIIKHAVDNNFI